MQPLSCECIEKFHTLRGRLCKQYTNEGGTTRLHLVLFTEGRGFFMEIFMRKYEKTKKEGGEKCKFMRN